MARYPVSVGGWSFHGLFKNGMMDIFHYIETISSRFRADNADIWSGFLPTNDVDFIKKVRRELDRRNLGVSNLCVDEGRLWMPTAEERDANRKIFLQYIDTARILGAQTIRIDFNSSRDDEMSEEAFEYIVERYREYCAICGDYGMKVGPENHFGFDRKLENLLKVWKAVGHPAYGHLLHLGNLENFMDNMDVLLPIVMHTHIPANSLPFAKEAIRRLAASGYKGTISAEHHTGVLELERTEWQLACVRLILAELEMEGADAPETVGFIPGIYMG